MNSDRNAASWPVTQSKPAPGFAWARAEALVPRLAVALVAIAAVAAAVMQPASAREAGAGQVGPVSPASSR